MYAEIVWKSSPQEVLTAGVMESLLNWNEFCQARRTLKVDVVQVARLPTVIQEEKAFRDEVTETRALRSSVACFSVFIEILSDLVCDKTVRVKLNYFLWDCCLLSFCSSLFSQSYLNSCTTRDRNGTAQKAEDPCFYLSYVMSHDGGAEICVSPRQNAP